MKLLDQTMGKQAWLTERNREKERERESKRETKKMELRV